MLLLSLRVLLAAVLAVAGTAKLLDRDGARRAAADFGVPAWLGPAVAVAELAVAAALLPGATAPVAAVAAAALLLAFSAAIAVSLVRGRAVACHCFGALSAGSAGPSTLGRNLALIGVAVAVAAAGPGDALHGAGIAVVVLALALVAGGVALLRVLQAHGRSLERVDRLEALLAEHGVAVPRDEPGLPVGTAAPGLAPGRVPVLLLFTDPGCAPCRALEPDIARWQESGALAVVEAGRDLWRAYEAAATPSAVLVSPDGLVASSLTTGADPIRALAARVTGGRRGRPVGTPVASLPVRTADTGEALDLAALGEETVLVFWNPGCGHCRAMEPALREWSGPPLLLVSAGGASEGLEARTVLDPGFDAGRWFGASGTPMAVRVDAEGYVASGLVAGADAALALARGPLQVVAAR